MSKIKKSTIRLRPIDYIVEGLGWFLLIFTIILAIYGYQVLPETVATHFNFKGQPDAYGSKTSILFIPIISFVLSIGISWLNRYPEIFNYPVKITEENATRQYRNAQEALRWLKVIVNLIFLLVTWSIFVSANSNISTQTSWLLPIIVFLPLIVIFLFVRKALKFKK